MTLPLVPPLLVPCVSLCAISFGVDALKFDARWRKWLEEYATCSWVNWSLRSHRVCVLTSQFNHASGEHLAYNTAVLGGCGLLLSHIVSPRLFAFTYLFGGSAASLGSLGSVFYLHAPEEARKATAHHWHEQGPLGWEREFNGYCHVRHRRLAMGFDGSQDLPPHVCRRP